MYAELTEGADDARPGDVLETESGTYQVIDTEPSTSYLEDESSGTNWLQFGIVGVVLVAIAGGAYVLRQKLRGGQLDDVQEVNLIDLNYLPSSRQLNDGYGLS